MSTTFAIAGMTCAGCVARVEAALRPLADAVAVTLDPPRAHLTGGRPVPLADAARAVAEAGRYRLSEVAEAAPAFVPSLEGRSATPTGLAAYWPLILVLGTLALASFAGARGATGAVDAHLVMMRFMAGFLIVFGAFKLIDPRGFADAYAAYDLIAARWRPWGLIYPFIELGLGFALLFGVAVLPAMIAMTVLSVVGGLGVLGALRSGRTIRCACLGTALVLPMSTVTLVENFGMAAMGAMMLAM